MNECGVDLFCDFLSQFITIYSPLQYALIKIVMAVTIILGSFLFGRNYGRADSSEAEEAAFVNGIMHYMNVRAYDAAEFPEKHNPDNDRFLLKAQQRLEKKLKPKLPK